MATKTTVLLDGLGFPECPRWHDGALWLSDMYANRVMRVDLLGKAEVVTTLLDTPIGLGWTSDRHLLIVSANERRLLRLEDDQLLTVADMSSLVTYPCNDMVVDRQGRAYVGNLGFDFGNPEAVPQPGPILLITPDGIVRTVAEGLAFPNGMVITPDGKTLIVAESHAARLTAFSIQADGSLGGRRVWAQFANPGDFSEGQITPDGLSLDAEGYVWLASPNTKEVVRVQEGGAIAERLPLERIPLACMLGGPDGRILFITTVESFDPGEGGSTGRLETVAVTVPGSGLP